MTDDTPLTRAPLAQALERLRPALKRMPAGEVWLAGAGPGDPGQLSVEVLHALTQADAVVYDALVDPAILDVAAQAELIFAGKRGGKASASQDEITGRLIALARQGRKVLRLKGGDPYIFGRGGEEALALAHAGIPFRVLPGITSALAALAGAGMPATMRGINKAIILATGHAAGDPDDLDWAALAATGQPLVVYMGMRNLKRIADALLSAGLAPRMPAAIIMSATTSGERILVSTLGAVARDAEAQGLESPALIVVGEIVSMRAELVKLDRMVRRA